MSRQIGPLIGEGIFQRITNPGLGGEVGDEVRPRAGDERAERFGLRDIHPHELEPRQGRKARRAGLLERHLVVGVEIVDADHPLASAKQPFA